MNQTGIAKIHIAAHALTVEAREESRRAGAVEALIVIENPNFHLNPFAAVAQPAVGLIKRQKPTRMATRTGGCQVESQMFGASNPGARTPNEEPQ